jgi:hypothetical protein
VALSLLKRSASRAPIAVVQSVGVARSNLVPYHGWRVGKDEVRVAVYEVTTPVQSGIHMGSPELTVWRLPVTVRPSTCLK